jgi:ankyrin repeat protein
MGVSLLLGDCLSKGKATDVGSWVSSLSSKEQERNKLVAQLLIEHGAEVDTLLGACYGSTLAAAAPCTCDDQSDFDSGIRLLLKHGADVNIPLRGKCGSALAAVRLMLDRGAEVNAPVGSNHGSALAAAAADTYNWPYSKPVVKLLLEHGAGVNSQLSSDYGSVLAGGRLVNRATAN